MKQALFITLEGGEGAGKSTQLPRIRSWLEAQGHRVRETRQPGGTPLSEKIRRLLLEDQGHDIRDLSELLLLFADRAQFMAEVVRPALAAGETILCDRFTDSTWAYQGAGRGVPDAWIADLAALVHGDRDPDLTVLFDVPVETGLARAVGRGEADRMESEDRAFHERVRRRYLELAAQAPGRFAVIDARPDPDAVWSEVEETLTLRLGE
jgi:dTMP kinase